MKRKRRYCVGCGSNVYTLHTHAVNSEEAERLSQILPRTVRTGDRLCCAHWQNHTSSRFTFAKRPKLCSEFAGRKWTSSTTHRLSLPLKAPHSSQEEKVKKMNRKHLEAQYLASQQRLQVIELELEALKHPGLTVAKAKLQDTLKYYTGFEVVEFDELCSLITKVPLKTKIPYCTHDVVLWGLAFLYRDLSWVDLEILTGISRQAVTTRVKDVLKELLNRLKEHDARNWPHFLPAGQLIPTNQDELDERFQNQCILVVDATHIPHLDTNDVRAHRMQFCRYKNTTCWKFFILTTLEGIITYVSPIYPGGTKSDCGYWDDSGVVQQLEEFYGRDDSLPEDRKQFCIWGDKGYPNMSKPAGWTVRITKCGKHSDIDQWLREHSE